MRRFRACPLDQLEKFIDEICDINTALSEHERDFFEQQLAFYINNVEQYILTYWGMDKYFKIRSRTNIMMSFPVRSYLCYSYFYVFLSFLTYNMKIKKFYDV